MNRRDFLLLRAEGRTAVLSCEALFMRFLDAQNDGTIDRLFANLRRDLEQVNAVTLVDPSWLAREDFGTHVADVLGAFRARGGRVVEP